MDERVLSYVLHYILELDMDCITGKVGISLNSEWFEPATYSTADKEAAEKAIQYQVSILSWTRSNIACCLTRVISTSVIPRNSQSLV
jgi:hypothetical protein